LNQVRYSSVTELKGSIVNRTLAVAAGGTFLVLVAFTTPLASLADTATTLHSDPGGQAWILSSMSVGLAVALLVSGAVADDYGRRKVFVAGAALLALTSVLAAVTPNTLVLVMARIGQGIGGAAVLSCSLGCIAAEFPAGPRRAHATGVWGASVGAGIAVGPVVMGLLAVAGSWRAGYWLLAGFTALLAVVARLVLTEERADRPRPVDVTGAVLLGAGLVALLSGLVEGRQDWGRPVVTGLFAAAVVLLAGFALWERRTRAPMLDLRLFRRPEFVASVVAGTATGAGIIALMSFTPTFFQRAFHYTTLDAALLLLAWSATSAVVALLARRLPAGLGVRARIVAGLVVIAGGQLMLTGLDTGTSATDLLPGLLVAGVGSGVLNAALGQIAVTSVPQGKASVGSGANNTARYVGAALGITVVAVIAAHPDVAALVAGWDTAAVVTAALSVAGALLVAVTGVKVRVSVKA
jgi:MFS family permease